MHSIEAKIQKNRRLTERLADDIARFAGSFGFFVLNFAVFISWILLNSGVVPGITPFDPFPFILLTMVVSLEAIFLSIFVLMSQNRASTIDTLREEIHLQINEIAEREITKALHLLADLHKTKFPNNPPDPELERMLKNTNTEKITEKLEKELKPEPMVIAELLEKLETRLPHFKSREKTA